MRHTAVYVASKTTQYAARGTAPQHIPGVNKASAAQIYGGTVDCSRSTRRYSDRM